MRFLISSWPRGAHSALMLCALTLLLSGCTSLAGKMNALPPVPRTPGAVVTDDFICIPHSEAGELLLWIEHAETQCR